jgi:hypothetical protein
VLHRIHRGATLPNPAVGKTLSFTEILRCQEWLAERVSVNPY